MIKDDVIETLNIFSEFNLNEKAQKKLFEEGLYFNFTYGDPDYGHINRYLSAIQVGRLIKHLRDNNIDFDIEELIYRPSSVSYGDIVRLIADNKDLQPISSKVKKIEVN